MTERQVALGVNKIPVSMDDRIWAYARERGMTKADATRALLHDALTSAAARAAAPAAPTGRRRAA